MACWASYDGRESGRTALVTCGEGYNLVMQEAVDSSPKRTPLVLGDAYKWSMGVFGALALLGGIQNHVWSQGTAHPGTWAQGMANGIIWMLPWGFIAPLIRVLLEWLPPRGRHPWAFLAGHLGGMVAVFVPLLLLKLGLGVLGVGFVKGWTPQAFESFHLTLPDLLTEFLGVPLVYGAVAAAWEALRPAQARRAQEARTALLAEQLSQARLALLKQQLHPHFLFNALQAISTLLHRDPAAADEALLNLSALLRRMLDDSGLQVTTLATELDLACRYLEIEQVRFQDRLQVAVAAPAETLEVAVPSLVLMPLVENAIRHGLSRKSAPGRISVDARLDGEHLRLTVEDDGPGASWPIQEHVGLASTRQRLEALYGPGACLALDGGAVGGFRAVVTLPREGP